MKTSKENRRGPPKKWKMTSKKNGIRPKIMEKNGRQPIKKIEYDKKKWKMTKKMEDNLNKKWKTTLKQTKNGR
jgi:hypothetical protein